MKKHKKFFYFCLIVSLVCFSLGIWQLHRYEIKKNWFAAYNRKIAMPPRPIQALSSLKSDIEYEHVSVAGTYLQDDQIVLQNRYYQGTVGYEVLTPFKVPQEKNLLLVDRGWTKEITGPALKSLLKLAGEHTITGQIKKIGGYQFILGENILRSGAAPLIMQKLDLIELSHLTNKTYFPYVLRLDAQSPGALVREWTVSTVSPMRHLGYAVQWFIFASIGMVGYYLVTKHDEK